MNKNVVKYKESIKKQISYGLMFFGIVLVSGISLYPVNTENKVILFCVISIAFAGVAIHLVRKAAKEAVCPHCNKDIYEVIQAAGQTKLQFKYCPSCGHEVKI